MHRPAAGPRPACAWRNRHRCAAADRPAHARSRRHRRSLPVRRAPAGTTRASCTRTRPHALATAERHSARRRRDTAGRSRCASGDTRLPRCLRHPDVTRSPHPWSATHPCHARTHASATRRTSASSPRRRHGRATRPLRDTPARPARAPRMSLASCGRAVSRAGPPTVAGWCFRSRRRVREGPRHRHRMRWRAGRAISCASRQCSTVNAPPRQ